MFYLAPKLKSMERIIKSLWFLSLMGVMGVLLFVYASLPDVVNYSESNSASRDFLFYVCVIILGVSNFSLYGISRRFDNSHNELATVVYGWLYAFNLLLNIFYSVVMIFINMFNGGESVQLSYYGSYIYISLGLLVVCILSLPVLIAKNISKS